MLKALCDAVPTERHPPVTVTAGVNDDLKSAALYRSWAKPFAASSEANQTNHAKGTAGLPHLANPSEWEGLASALRETGLANQKNIAWSAPALAMRCTPALVLAAVATAAAGWLRRHLRQRLRRQRTLLGRRRWVPAVDVGGWA